MRSSRQQLGQRGEELAESWLAQRGYRLRERNYRCLYGEIDRIMEAGETLVFVEVKTRRSEALGTPAEAVDERKRRQITRTALFYMQQQNLDDAECRFDLVEVELYAGQPPAILHHPGAFDAVEA